eukprot:CAMPEP_0201671984 /NCGR_PEP_ID=MMETSP0494-20130426/31237_1 /ASSEMBLY_ACC=CAM_ASM_000839 /TAXON_ID=420259 /ORGANISM="Thalassiosira gravida, Strain GMp14c1" /LENGTH=264 /DNA_ID=CAMNT_0048153499 /DNA_START=237 /DNA_END=1031 /DNA_ORIENTATION=+
MNRPSNFITSNPTHVIPRTSSTIVKRGPRGGIYDPFPIKFYRMLDQVRDEGLESTVSWLSHGRAFKIHKPKAFAATIMTRFFNQSKYTSFQRQLNLYGFSRCSRGRDSGAYYHPFFLRGHQSMAKNITRTKVKGNGHKTMKFHEAEPDFYSMAPLVDNNSHEISCDGSSIGSVPSFEQPTMAAPLAGFGRSKSSAPSPSPSLLPVGPYARQVSSGDLSARRVSSLRAEGGNSTDFVNDLNQSIFIHELAMGCTILCQLRRATHL